MLCWKTSEQHDIYNMMCNAFHMPKCRQAVILDYCKEMTEH